MFSAFAVLVLSDDCEFYAVPGRSDNMESRGETGWFRDWSPCSYVTDTRLHFTAARTNSQLGHQEDDAWYEYAYSYTIWRISYTAAAQTNSLWVFSRRMKSRCHWFVSWWWKSNDVHIVDSYLLTKLNGGLSQLHSADDEAVTWLTSYSLLQEEEVFPIYVATTVITYAPYRVIVINSRHLMHCNWPQATIYVLP